MGLSGQKKDKALLINKSTILSLDLRLVRDSMKKPGIIFDENETIQLSSGNSWITLSYFEDEKNLYLMSTGQNSRWPSEVLRKGSAVFRLKGEIRSGTAELIGNSLERKRIMDSFRIKYGDEKYSRWFQTTARVIKITSAQKRIPENELYYRWLESEFDSVAYDYDRHITGNSINMLLRDRSLKLMRHIFSNSHTLLEIGCGSGMETLPMLREGHDVVALDISSEMLRVVENKSKSAGLSGQLITRKMKASQIEELAAEFGEEFFDGAYSTYGALNCEPSLIEIPRALGLLLKKESRFVAGIYNKFCLTEILGYGLTLRLGRIAGRVESRVLEGSSRFCIDVYPYSVLDFETIFSPFFKKESVIGVPVILPPSDLDRYARKFSSHREKLYKIDMLLGRIWPFYALGDHFLMTLSKKN